MRLTVAALLLLAAACGRTVTYIPREGCSSAKPCNDDVPCTADLCLPDGTCRFVPDDSLCEGSFCMLNARCDVKRGCAGMPRDCSNDLDCDTDTCDEAARLCRHTLDNTKCPMGQICTPDGCRDCRTDSDCNDGRECTRDTCSAGRCTRVTDVSLCNDNVSCTIDSCTPDGACRHQSSDALCNDGIMCTDDRCAGAAGCMHTAVSSRCNDMRFCNGVEVCDVMRGCVPGAPPVCNDNIDCTVDRCDMMTDRCAATPNDALCPVGFFCGTNGCAVFAYAVSNDGLYDVRLPAGQSSFIGTTRYGGVGPAQTLTDVALDSDGGLYGMQGPNLVLVDRLNANLTMVRNLNQAMNALDVLPGGLLYGSGGSSVFSVNRSTGQLTTVATLPAGQSASGDIAVVSGRIYITTTNGTPGSTDRLVEVMPDGGPSRVVGDTTVDCLWGLAAYGPLLYGFDCNGQIHRIDLTTGRATAIATGGPDWWGASSR